jgi:hypothetical protein
MTDIEKLVLGNARALRRRVAATEADVVTALEWAAQWRRVAQLQARIIRLYDENARSDAKTIGDMVSAVDRHHAKSEELDGRWREIKVLSDAVIDLLGEEKQG